VKYVLVWLITSGAFSEATAKSLNATSYFGGGKFNRGRKAFRGFWAFGAFERGTKNVYFTKVKNRTAKTLSKIITEHIAPGTTIYTDQWRGYTPLKKLGYNHQTVNHSVEFVSPVNKKSPHAKYRAPLEHNKKLGATAWEAQKIL